VERRGLPLQFALDLMLMPVLFVSAPQLWLQRAETIVSTATNFGFAPVASRASDADADDILAPTRTLESSSLSVKQRAGRTFNCYRTWQAFRADLCQRSVVLDAGC